MLIDTKNMISITEANQNFSKVTKQVDKNGSVVIFKNNKPKYVVSNVDEFELQLTENEKLEIIAKRILKEHKHAFEELAK